MVKTVAMKVSRIIVRPSRRRVNPLDCVGGTASPFWVLVLPGVLLGLVFRPRTVNDGACHKLIIQQHQQQ